MATELIVAIVGVVAALIGTGVGYLMREGRQQQRVATIQRDIESAKRQRREIKERIRTLEWDDVPELDKRLRELEIEVQPGRGRE